jgi:uncharacterized protein YciI
MFTNCKINSFYRAVNTDLKTNLLKKIMEHKHRLQHEYQQDGAQLLKMTDCNSDEDAEAAESEVVAEDAEAAESEVVAEDDDQASQISKVLYVLYIYVMFLYTMHMLYSCLFQILQRHLLFQHRTN